MHDAEVKRKARLHYLSLRNDEQVAAQLKHEGDDIPVSTISRWRRKSKGEWEKAGEEYDKNYAKEMANLKGFESTWAARLAGMLEKVSKKIETAEKPDSQDLYALKNLLTLACNLKKGLDKTKLDDNDTVQVLLEVMMSDPELEPILKRKWNNLLEKVEQRLKVM